MGWGEGFVELYLKKTTCQNRLLYDPLAVKEGKEVNLHEFHLGHKLYIGNVFPSFSSKKCTRLSYTGFYILLSI